MSGDGQHTQGTASQDQQRGASGKAASSWNRGWALGRWELHCKEGESIRGVECDLCRAVTHVCFAVGPTTADHLIPFPGFSSRPTWRAAAVKARRNPTIATCKANIVSTRSDRVSPKAAACNAPEGLVRNGEGRADHFAGHPFERIGRSPGRAGGCGGHTTTRPKGPS